jgi:hypothetical protein
MAWGKLSSTTLTTTADDISTGTITANKFHQMLIYGVSSGVGNTSLRFNSDTGSNYAKRRSHNGGADATSVSQTSTNTDGFTSRENFDVVYIINISSEEKLLMRHTVDRETAGAGTAPARIEVVSKWANTSAQITQTDVVNTLAGDLTTDSNLTVLGSDITPAAATIQDGLIFEETDTNLHYIFNSTAGTWTEI